MSLLRNFWIEVVGIDKPKLNLRPKIVIPRTHRAEPAPAGSHPVDPLPARPHLVAPVPASPPAPAADEVGDIEQQAEAAEEQAQAAEQQAQAASKKADVLERLAGLAGQYKQAVADNGPDAPQLQAMFGIIKTALGKQKFTEAAEGLDLLENLLNDHSGTTDDSTSPEEKHGMGLDLDENDAPPEEHGMGVEIDEEEPDEYSDGEASPEYEEQAEAAAYRAEVMKRLAALTNPFRKIVSGGGPHVERVQTHFNEIKAHLGQQRFTDVALGLDLLEEMLAEHANAGPDTLDGSSSADESHGMGLDLDDDELATDEHGTGADEDSPEAAPEASEAAGSDQSKTFECRVFVKNNTDGVLHLRATGGTRVHYETRPTDIAPNGEIEFVVSDDQFVDAFVTWQDTLDEHASIWFVGFKFKPTDDKDGVGETETHVSGENSGRLVPGQPVHKGKRFEFSLNGKGPAPEPPQPPSAQAATNLSCRVTVTNKTQSVLTLTNQDNAVGDFMTNPASALQPGDSTSFVFVQTPNQNDKSTSIQGSVTWDVGSPAVATWRCEWTNPAGQKNTAHGTVDPGSAGFKSLDQVDQGDENVPVAFTLLGGSQGPPVAPPVNPPNGPPVNPPDVPPQPPDGPEPEYKPPTEEKQPTLRQGDKSKDGWVEYLQQRLNRWVQPSPNLKEDGDFGPVTHKAVLAFQQQFGIQVDGVVGNQTWAALRRAPSEKPGTDGRQPHTFVDKGVKARWITEGRNAIYNTGSDTMTLKAVSVGTDTKLEGQKVNVFVTAPGGKRKGITPKLGPPTHKTDTGEGDEHEVVIPNFTKTFPSTPPGAAVTSYVVEAYFDGPLGGDYWTSATTQILVQ